MKYRIAIACRKILHIVDHRPLSVIFLGDIEKLFRERDVFRQTRYLERP